MFSKNGRYYADWRTPEGKRKRKAFDTPLGAKRYESKMKNAAPREAQSAATVRVSPNSRASAPPQKSSGASLQKPNSPISPSRRSTSRKTRGSISVARPATRTPDGSAASSKRSKQQARQPSRRSSGAASRRSPEPSAQPKKKRGAASRAQTSASAGLSPARSTLGFDTRQPLTSLHACSQPEKSSRSRSEAEWSNYPSHLVSPRSLRSRGRPRSVRIADTSTS